MIHTKFVIFVAISSLVVLAIYSSSTYFVFAKPPKFGTVETCTDTYSKKNPNHIVSTKCCMETFSNGKPLGPPVCKKTCYDSIGKETKCVFRSEVLDGITNDTGNNTSVLDRYVEKGGALLKDGGNTVSNNTSTNSNDTLQ